MMSRRPLRQAAHEYLHEIEGLTEADVGGRPAGQLVLVAYRVALMLAVHRPDYARELLAELEEWMPPEIRAAQHAADRELLASLPPAVLS